MRLSVKITGGAELARQLNRLADDVASEKLEQAVTAGALLVANAAKQKAHYLTGNLRRSIHVGGHVAESGGLQDTEGTDIGGNESRRGQASVLVGTNVEYAKYLELGTSQMPSGYPFLRPALDENRAKVTREIIESLRDLLRKL